ncbi:MAG: 50S ribosomal protein L11 methyltransferase [Verrucomicrobiales bacterium]
MGAGSLVITEFAGRKNARLDVYCRRRADAERIQRQLGGRVRWLKTENWAALAIPKIAPIKIRDRFLIVSTEDEAEIERLRSAHPNRELLRIPIEMAFGTGDHPTTATCLRLMCDLDMAGRSVLDLGCGTGILALAARKLGAARVLAVDCDREAVAASKRNARRNKVRGIQFERCDILSWEPSLRFDIIVANIFADVLTALFAKMKRALAPGGVLILSGILDKDGKACLQECRKEGFRFERVVKRGKWMTAQGRSVQEG